MTTEHMTRNCTLAATVGKDEPCPEAACPFWEPGGAALGGQCAFEHLGVVTDAQLAQWLLEIRERLAVSGSEQEERAMRSAFHHLLNESAE